MFTVSLCLLKCNVLTSTQPPCVRMSRGGTVETWKRSFHIPVRHTVETSKLGFYGGNGHFESFKRF